MILGAEGLGAGGSWPTFARSPRNVNLSSRTIICGIWPARVRTTNVLSTSGVNNTCPTRAASHAALALKLTNCERESQDGLLQRPIKGCNRVSTWACWGVLFAVETSDWVCCSDVASMLRPRPLFQSRHGKTAQGNSWEQLDLQHCSMRLCLISKSKAASET